MVLPGFGAAALVESSGPVAGPPPSTDVLLPVSGTLVVAAEDDEGRAGADVAPLEQAGTMARAIATANASAAGSARVVRSELSAQPP